jgi:hypothetical protein
MIVVGCDFHTCFQQGDLFDPTSAQDKGCATSGPKVPGRFGVCCSARYAGPRIDVVTLRPGAHIQPHPTTDAGREQFVIFLKDDLQLVKKFGRGARI